MRKTRAKHAQNMRKTCAKHAQKTFKISKKFQKGFPTKSGEAALAADLFTAFPDSLIPKHIKKMKIIAGAPHEFLFSSVVLAGNVWLAAQAHRPLLTSCLYVRAGRTLNACMSLRGFGVLVRPY